MKKTIIIVLLVITRYVYSQLTQQWAYSYNYVASSCDIPGIMKLDKTGNIYLTGTSQRDLNNQTPSDILTMRINPSGIIVWMKSYNGPGNNIDKPCAMNIDNAGNIYIAGSSVRQIRGWDGVLIKYNPAGLQQWVKIYDVPETEYNVFNDMIIDKAGNIYVSGFTGGNIIVIKYDPSGVQQWITKISEQQYHDAAAITIALDSANNIYISGNNCVSDMNYNLLTAKFNNSGSTQWIRTFNCQLDPINMKQYVSVDSDNNFYVAATASVNGSYNGIYTFKYNNAGNLLWYKRFGYDTASNSVSGLNLDIAGNILVSGTLYNNIMGFDMSSIKYSSGGIELWRQLFTYQAGTYAIAYSQTLDKTGNLYITGWANKVNQSSTGTTIKYSSSGILQWIRQYTANESNWTFDVLTDTLYNVFISGYQNNSSTNADYLLIKYNQPIAINPISSDVPKTFSLYQNYPNPFNPATKIKFDIPNKGLQPLVQIKVFDVLGREVSTLVNEQLKPGTYEVDFDGSKLASGIYYYSLSAGNYAETKKMVLMK